MSTFTDWNGPGDCPGDLTILYQRLMELRGRVNQFDSDNNSFRNEVRNEVAGAENAAGDAEQAVNDAIAQMTDLYNRMKTLIDTFTKNPDGSVTINNELKIPKLEGIEGINKDSSGKYKIKFMQGWIESAEVWLFTATATFMNSPKIFDHVAWKIATPRYAGEPQPYNRIIDPDLLNFVNADPSLIGRLKDPTCTRRSGYYILAVIDDMTDTLGSNDMGAGHIYFTVKDTSIMTFVLTVAAALEQPNGSRGATYHAALHATYCYSNTGQQGSDRAFEGVEFAVWKLTNEMGHVSLYVTARILNLTNPPIGYTWFTGRGMRRCRQDGENFSPDEDNIIEYIRTEDLIGRERCHGNAMTGIVTNDQYVQEELTLEEGSVFEHKGIELNSTSRGGYPSKQVFVDTFFSQFVHIGPSNPQTPKKPGDLEVDGDLTIHGNLNVQGASGTAVYDNVVAENIIANKDVIAGDRLSADKLQIGSMTLPETLKSGEAYIENALMVGLDARYTQGDPDDLLNPPTEPPIDLYDRTFIKKGKIETLDLRVRDIARVETITDLSTYGETWLQHGTNVQLGRKDKSLRLETDTSGVWVDLGENGDEDRVVLTRDLESGTTWKGNILAITQSIPDGNFRDLIVSSTLIRTIKVGDVVLVMQDTGNDYHVPDRYRCTEVDALGYPSWERVVPPYNKPEFNGKLLWTWEWFGLTLTATGKWTYSRVFWNPNEVEPNVPYANSWTVVALGLDGFRDADAQNEIDHFLAMLISDHQPDWLDEEPVINIDPPTSAIPRVIPNPSYINNRPWIGMTTLDGGDWDLDETKEYNFVLWGGEFDQVMRDLEGSMTLNERAVSQQFKSGIIRVMHGHDNKLPVGSPNTAFTFKYTTDKQQLWLDLGAPDAVVDNFFCKNGNALIHFDKKPYNGTVRLVRALSDPSRNHNWPCTIWQVEVSDIDLVPGEYSVQIGDQVFYDVPFTAQDDSAFVKAKTPAFQLTEGKHELIVRVNDNPITVLPVVIEPMVATADVTAEVELPTRLDKPEKWWPTSRWRLIFSNLNLPVNQSYDVEIGPIHIPDDCDFGSDGSFTTDYYTLPVGDHYYAIKVNGDVVETMHVTILPMVAMADIITEEVGVTP